MTRTVSFDPTHEIAFSDSKCLDPNPHTQQLFADAMKQLEQASSTVAKGSFEINVGFECSDVQAHGAPITARADNLSQSQGGFLGA